MKNALRAALASVVMTAAVAGAGTLTVPLLPQEQDQWCWAASGQMIMKYLGATRVSQCEQANRRQGRTDCCARGRAGCNLPGMPEFEKFGFTYDTSSTLSWGSLKNEIDNNRPVAFSWVWTGGSSHMMVATGYDVFRLEGRVVVNDPWPPGEGDAYYISYSEYVSSSGHTHLTDYFNIRDAPACATTFNSLQFGSFVSCADYQSWRERWAVTVSSFQSNTMAGSFQTGAYRPVHTTRTKSEVLGFITTYRAQGWRPDQLSAHPGAQTFDVIWAPAEGTFESVIDLTEAEFSSKFSAMWNAGYLQVDLAVYNQGSTVRYAGTWVQKAHGGYYTYTNMTAAEYDQRRQAFSAQGLHPVRFSAYTTPSGTRYAALWHPSATPLLHAYNMSSASYLSTASYVDSLNAGYRLLHVNGANGILSAIWTK